MDEWMDGLENRFGQQSDSILKRSHHFLVENKNGYITAAALPKEGCWRSRQLKDVASLWGSCRALVSLNCTSVACAHFSRFTCSSQKAKTWRVHCYPSSSSVKLLHVAGDSDHLSWLCVCSVSSEREFNQDPPVLTFFIQRGLEWAYIHLNYFSGASLISLSLLEINF